MNKASIIAIGCFSLTVGAFVYTFVSCNSTNTNIKGTTHVVSKTKEKIVAKVNGQPIYTSDLHPYVQKELMTFKKYAIKRDTSDLEKRLRRKVLDKVIEQKILAQESIKVKIDDIESKISERAKNVRAKYRNKEDYENMLRRTGVTPEQMRENIRREIHINAYLESKKLSNPDVPEEDIKDFYQHNPENFRQEEYVKVSHILLKVSKDASPEEIETVKKKAVEIRNEIISGKDFGAYARKFSEDGRASRGGDLDFIKRGYMPPEFDKVAFSLDVNAVSEPVRTEYGFHIIKVVEKKPGGIARYEDVKDFIRKFLQQEMSKKIIALHMNELKQKAKIEIMIDES